MNSLNPRPVSEPLLPPANKARRRRSVINLTPLIDVVFILLIFFMLASALEQWNAVELDAPEHGTTQSSPDGAVLIEIQKDGLQVESRRVSPEALSRRVREQVKRKPGQRFLIRPDAGVPLQKAIDAIDLIAAAGSRNVSLIRAPSP
ncbi:MAG: biopolymer transporter ExbD [Rhodospirillales bacterium]